MKFSEKMWLMIILKVSKKQGFALSQENTFLEKPLIRKTPNLFRVKKNKQMCAIFKTRCFYSFTIKTKTRYEI